MSIDNIHRQQDFKPSREKTSLGKETTTKRHMTPSKTPNMLTMKSPTKIAQNQYRKTLASIDQLSESMLQLDLKEQKIMNNGAFGTSTKMRGGSLNKSSKI